MNAPTARALLQALADSEMPPEVWGTQERAVRLPFDVDSVVAAWKGSSPAAYLRRKSPSAFDSMLLTSAGSYGDVEMTSGIQAGLPTLFSLCESWAVNGKFHYLACGAHGPIRHSADGRTILESESDRSRQLLASVIWLAPSNYVMEGIVGLAQRTYFGPHYVAQFGADLLRTIPGAFVRECGEGLLVDLAKEPWTLTEDVVLEKLAIAMQHLAPALVFAVPNENMTRWRMGERCRPY